MKVISYFINYSIQNTLITLVEKRKIPHRVRANKRIETSKKWIHTIEDLCTDISFDLFEKPAFLRYGKGPNYKEYIYELADHNIPFFTFVIDDEYTIITSESDCEYLIENVKDPLGYLLEDI